MRVHTLLAFCTKYKSPLAMVHLARIIDHYFEDKPKLIFEFQEELLKGVTDCIQVKLDDNTPYFDLGEIYRLQNKDEMNTYKAGSKLDFRCLYQDTNDKNVLKKISTEDPVALIHLAILEDDPKEKPRYYIATGQEGVPYGWFKAGTLSEENCEDCLTKAAEAGIASAYLTLGEYYSDIGDTDKMITLFESSNDCPAVFDKLGDLYRDNDELEKAKTCYSKNILTGFRLLSDLDKTSLQKCERDLEEYFLGLKKIINGEYPNMKSKDLNVFI